MEAFKELSKPLLNYLIKPVPRTVAIFRGRLAGCRDFSWIFMSRPCIGLCSDRIIERYVTRSSQSFVSRNVSALIISRKRGILTNPSISNRAQTRASSSRREEREREERRTTHFSFPLRRYSSPQHLNTVAAPTLPFLSVPCRSGSLFTHTYTHTYTYIHVAKNRGGEEIVTERGEREREGYGKIRHRDVARGVSPPTESLAAAPLLRSPPPARARGLDAPLRTARRRLVASSARAHASRRARTSPLDCSFARPSRGHPPAYFPRS